MLQISAYTLTVNKQKKEILQQTVRKRRGYSPAVLRYDAARFKKVET